MLLLSCEDKLAIDSNDKDGLSFGAAQSKDFAQI